MVNERNRGLLIGVAICLGVSACAPAPAEPVSFQDCVNVARAWHAKTGEKTTQATLNRCMCEAHPDEYGPACWVDEELATVREANKWLDTGTEAKAVKASPSEPERVLGDHNQATSTGEAHPKRLRKGNEEWEPKYFGDVEGGGPRDCAVAVSQPSFTGCISKASPYGADFALGKPAEVVREASVLDDPKMWERCTKRAEWREPPSCTPTSAESKRRCARMWQHEGAVTAVRCLRDARELQLERRPRRSSR